MKEPSPEAIKAARELYKQWEPFSDAVIADVAQAFDAFAEDRIDSREMRIVRQCQSEMDEAGLDIIKQRTFMNILENALDAIRQRGAKP